MSKGFKLFLRILLYIFSTVPLLIIANMITDIFDKYNDHENLIKIILVILLIIEITVTEILLYRKNKKKNSLEVKNTNSNTKICKYCQSEINSNATVCPICKRGLSFSTNKWVFAILLIIFGFLLWGIFSNDAPLFMRKTVCGLGIRKDFPYCYYIDFNN